MLLEVSLLAMNGAMFLWRWVSWFGAWGSWARAAALGVLFGACASTAGVEHPPRRETRPPSFSAVQNKVESIDFGSVRAEMWQLADRVHALEQTLRATESNDGETQRRAIQILDAMQEVVRRIDVSAYTDDEHHIGLAAFRAELGSARRGAARRPPDYRLAANLTGACVYCHR